MARHVKTAKEKAAALLHDVIEDSNLSIQDLRAFGISPTTIDSVIALTHRSEETYSCSLERAASDLVADLDHNADLSRYPNPGVKEKDRCDKYLLRTTQFLKLLSKPKLNPGPY